MKFISSGLLQRRGWLALGLRGALAVAATGCASGRSVTSVDADVIEEVATRHRLSAANVVARLRGADVALLGELHDNPWHHKRRAALLEALDSPVPVVVEQLPRGSEPAWPATADDGALLQALEHAGFDARGWRWPLHRPLFRRLAARHHAVRGGNLDRDAVRRVVRDGVTALPPNLRTAVVGVPLAPAALRALEQALQDGHCGQLGARSLPGMVAAQRGRDASMASELLAALAPWRTRGGRGPVVLLAGNGHVRRDHGVPQLLAAQRPDLRLLAIGFAERPASTAPPADAPFDIVWSTPPAVRDDPCAGFAMPPAPPR